MNFLNPAELPATEGHSALLCTSLFLDSRGETAKMIHFTLLLCPQKPLLNGCKGAGAHFRCASYGPRKLRRNVTKEQLDGLATRREGGGSARCVSPVSSSTGHKALPSTRRPETRFFRRWGQASGAQVESRGPADKSATVQTSKRASRQQKS